MKAEREEKERLEKERLVLADKIKGQFADANGQWEKDKADIQREALKEKDAADKAAEKDKPAGQKIVDVAAGEKVVDDAAKPVVAGPAKPNGKA